MMAGQSGDINTQTGRRKNILYVGNKLSRHGHTPTNIETLGPQLAGYYNIVATSDRKNKLLRLADMAFTILKHKSNTDLIIIDTYSTSAFKFAKLAGRLARRTGIPYIAILHGGDLPKMLKRASESDLLFFEKAAKLVAPSPYLFQLFKEFGFKHLLYIPNNINLEDYNFKERKSVEPKLLWVRSFHKIYNPNMALQVMRQLLPDYPGATLCMIGPDKDGSMERAKRVAGTYGITDKVQFTGKLDKSAWHEYAASFDIFINTTNTDNTPISVIEAMALGLPVVTTNPGGIPYLVQHNVNALMVPVADAEAMTVEIRRLIEQPGLAASLAAAGGDLVRSFSWREVKLKWFDLIDEVTA